MFRRRRNGTAADAAQNGDAPLADRRPGHLIDLRSVVKDYVTDAGPFRALDHVDLQVDPGEFIAVVGRSGCGKSTLMNMITGIDRATEGSVTVAGQSLEGLSEGKVAEWRGRTVVMVTHDADLAGRTRRIVHMADGRILDGTLDPTTVVAPQPAGAPA